MKNKQISVGVEPNNYELEVTAANFWEFSLCHGSQIRHHHAEEKLPLMTEVVPQARLQQWVEPSWRPQALKTYDILDI